MSSSASQVALRTPIAALTSTTGNAIKVFFQDVLGGIRLASYDGNWSGGTSTLTTAKFGTPLAAIGSPSLDKIRLYYLSPENILQELCNDSGGSGTWYNGLLNDSNINVAPYSQLAAVCLTVFNLRVYVQKPDNTIQEFAINEQPDWSEGANLGGALPGTSIAATAYAGTSKIRLFFQTPDLTIQGIGTDGGEWQNEGLNIASSFARGAISLVSYIDPLNNSNFSVRIYYTVEDNHVKEKIFNAGTQSGWVDGTLNIQTIPGSNFNAIVWTSGDSVVLRGYLQQGQQVSAISEWAGDTSQWALQVAALPPATV